MIVSLLVAGCASSASRGDRVRTVMNAPSGKQITIYRSSQFTTEPQEVAEDVVVRAMRSAAVFLEDDVRSMSARIGKTLGELEEDERVVVETSDGAVHFFVLGGELQIISFHAGHEVSRHASPIPGAAVKAQLATRETPPASQAPPPATTPPPSVPVTPAPVVTPPAKPAEPPPPEPSKPAPPQPAKVEPKLVKPATPKPVAPAPAKKKPLTEAEIRARLAELERLHAKQLISDDEYKTQRKQLLDQL